MASIRITFLFPIGTEQFCWVSFTKPEWFRGLACWSNYGSSQDFIFSFKDLCLLPGAQCSPERCWLLLRAVPPPLQPAGVSGTHVVLGRSLCQLVRWVLLLQSHGKELDFFTLVEEVLYLNHLESDPCLCSSRNRTLCGHRFASYHGSHRDFTTSSALLKPLPLSADTLPFSPSATNMISLNELLSTEEMLGVECFDYLFYAFFQELLQP